MAAPFGRHGLRADGCCGEQAASGYAACPYGAFGQALYGVGHGTQPRGGFGGDVQKDFRRAPENFG